MSADKPRQGWTALLLAGSRPNDPLALSLGTDLKPLLPLAGEPMLLRPLRALLAVPEVAAVRVLTQQPERIAAVLPDDPRIAVETSDSTIAATLLRLCDDPATRFPLLVTTADHALLTPAMVEEFLAGATGSDVAVGVVSRTAMLRRFPDAQRTWLRFGAERYSGANLFALATPAARAGVERWRAIEQDRKKGWRVLLQLGLPLFLGAVLRLSDIHQTARGLGRRLGVALKAVVLSDPTAAIDVDKPADHLLVSAIIEGRA
ncbi:NTP transferase domain-containing protein [Sphingomonas astaxanthinifaciens]|uniref:MobA-like NTP transferase domain-containing protein n=1 Tax=Sphingomonas astaxanthinifaciens DSM 22298 TaxID=1123267 RepID=A0ABQ5Z1H1_9SPHN|nr:NTP transferase domain-containing protein [Sphingomonas astaxanthinifaciens]GLR46604.1 hypothetical protein GCM10007925_03150 [Sphingomonas astaxanthinifaciens DSM 22298]